MAAPVIHPNMTTIACGFADFTGIAPAGGLVDDTGDRGFTTDDESYTVKGIYVGSWDALAGVLFFRLNKDFRDSGEETLVFHIEIDGASTEWMIDDSAVFGNITGANSWSSSGLDWSSVTEVTVHLRVADNS